LPIEFAPALLASAGRDAGRFLDTLGALGFRIDAIDARGNLRTVTRTQLLASCSGELLLSR
jgi:hypothetical protein